ncbi:MAG: hypothetical protein ACWGHH_00380 [Sulfurovaceae bacterium]
MKKTFIMIISVIAMISLAKCGYDEIVYGDMTPMVNPHPTKKVRIHGKFPFDENMTLAPFDIVYINENPKCNKKYKAFDIFLSKSAKQSIYIKSNIIKQANSYEAYYYQDYFLPGECEWTFHHYEPRFIWNLSSLKTPSGYYDTDGFSEDSKHSNKILSICKLRPLTEVDTRDLPNSWQLYCFQEGNYKDFVPYRFAKDIELNFIYKGKEKYKWQK